MGLERCRPKVQQGECGAGDPLAAESLNRVTPESTPRGQPAPPPASAVLPVGQQSAEEPTRASAVFLPGNASAGTEREPQRGGQPGSRWARPKCLCRGLRRLSSRKGNPSGASAPDGGARLSERGNRGSRGPGVRLTGGAPPSSPNPRKLQTRNHDPPGGSETMGRSLRRPPAQSVQGTPVI